MTDKAAQDRLVVPAKDRPRAAPSTDDLEKLRLQFELELLLAQNAGAALDPLLRRKRNGTKPPA